MMRSAVAAFSFWSADRQRIAAHPSGDADAEGAAGHALADDRRDDRHLQAGHLAEVHGDGLADAALLGAEPRVGADRVDERDHRTAELLRLAHESQRLAIPLGMGHAEVAVEVLLHVPALLLADDHDRAPVEAAPTAHDRTVVAEIPVAVELDPVLEHPLDVVEGVRPTRVTRDLNLLDGLQVVVRLFLQLLELASQDVNLFGHVDASAIGEVQEFGYLILDLDDVTLEI